MRKEKKMQLAGYGDGYAKDAEENIHKQLQAGYEAVPKNKGCV